THHGDTDQAPLKTEPAKSKIEPPRLRKSCDYCVRMKRACDGKTPCEMCTKRNKVCTRSFKKKSGPAKGSKYSTRRKRVLAEMTGTLLCSQGSESR
ncbi:unnamed protein product, partial [Choristocarpus tenellus]